MDPSAAALAPSTVTSFLRRGLEEEAEDLYLNFGFDDAVGASADDSYSTVFWGVNGFISFLLGSVLLWCCFSKKEWLSNPDERRRQTDLEYQQSLREREEARQKAKVDSPEKRTRKLIKSFQKHNVVMIVKNEDIVEDVACVTKEADLDISSSSLESGPTGHLKLKGSGRLVPNCCAICLGSYDEGDKVVWSSNPTCAHAFHEECVVGWLVKFQPETPCPCCRQEFTDLEKIREESKITWSGPAFDLGFIAFR